MRSAFGGGVSSSSGLYIGRSSSRRSSRTVSAPAAAAPASATLNAARLFDVFASEPPSPTIFNAIGVHHALVPVELPNGTVTFLCTDVEGSTKLLHELGAEPYAA